MIPTILEDLEKLFRAIELNTEYVTNNNFTDGAEGLSQVVKIQSISDELEDLKFNLSKYGYDIEKSLTIKKIEKEVSDWWDFFSNRDGCEIEDLPESYAYDIARFLIEDGYTIDEIASVKEYNFGFVLEWEEN